jgi:hypothetical protein
MTLVGIVENPGLSKPQVYWLLPPEYQSTKVTPDAPPVWLVSFPNVSGHAYHLIPGNRDSGTPRLRKRSMGGNYAVGLEPEFAILVSTLYPIPIHDRLPTTSDRDSETGTGK